MKQFIVITLLCIAGLFVSSTSLAKEVTLPAIPVAWYQDKKLDLSDFHIDEARTLYNSNKALYPYYAVYQNEYSLYLVLSSSPLYNHGVEYQGITRYYLEVTTESNLIFYKCSVNNYVPTGWEHDNTLNNIYSGFQFGYLSVDGKVETSALSLVYFNNNEITPVEGSDSNASVPTYTFEHYLDTGYDREHAGSETPPKEEDSKAWYEYILDIPGAIWDLFKGAFNLLQVPLNAIAEFIGRLDEILNDINNWFFDIVKFLFIPEENPFEQFSDTIDKKFPIVNQITDVVRAFFSPGSYYNENGTGTTLEAFEKSPGASFTFSWKGKTYTWLEFDLFKNDILPKVRAIVAGFLWVAFAIRTYKKLPQIISGLHG